MKRADSTAPSPPSTAQPEQPKYRLPDEVTTEEITAMDRVLDVDTEAYLRWLETGVGPDPCASCS